nr:hypothetical protein [Tanacetum cinerariifolium]
NACPLTRITTFIEVASRNPIALEIDTTKHVITLVYSRKPKKSKSIDPVSNSKVVQIVLWYLDSGCSKHMTGDRSQLNNFVNKFLARHGLVRGHPKLKFKKDHLCSACAMGKSKKKPHKPKSEDTNQEKLYLLHMDLCGPMHVVGITHEKIVSRSPHQNGVVERRNHTLIEAARIISEPTLHEMTPATISLGLVPNPPSSTSFVPPLKIDWDLLFQPLFDELLTTLPSVDHPAPKVIAPIAEVVALEPAALTSSPSSTTIDQDASSPSNSQTTLKT